jgi:PmbA protein
MKDHRNYNSNPINSTDLLPYAEDILEKLRRDYPDFDFSEGIAAKEVTWQMQNTEGLDLEYRDAWLELGLILKEKKSANLFDGFLLYSGRSYDMEHFWAFNKGYLDAYYNIVPLPEGDVLPVFSWGLDELTMFLSRSLNGERYATGSSIFSGKMGQKLFHDKLVLEQNRSPLPHYEPFFDMEGVVLENDRSVLVDKGRLVSVYTDKKTADLYNLPHTGAASGEYDDKPGLSTAPIEFAVDSDDVKAALGGKMAILVAASSGGDLTSDGSYAAPVQLAFLFDGEKIIGKLPEFTMRSHLYKMLGEDYIGTFENKHFYLGDGVKLQGYYMTIVGN